VPARVNDHKEKKPCSAEGERGKESQWTKRAEKRETAKHSNSKDALLPIGGGRKKGGTVFATEKKRKGDRPWKNPIPEGGGGGLYLTLMKKRKEGSD